MDAEPVSTAAIDLATAIARLAAKATATVSPLSFSPPPAGVWSPGPGNAARAEPRPIDRSPVAGNLSGAPASCNSIPVILTGADLSASAHVATGPRDSNRRRDR